LLSPLRGLYVSSRDANISHDAAIRILVGSGPIRHFGPEHLHDLESPIKRDVISVCCVGKKHPNSALDVTLAYLKGKDAESEEAQEHANSSSLALYA
jgi:hypothetical protein